MAHTHSHSPSSWSVDVKQAQLARDDVVGGRTKPFGEDIRQLVGGANVWSRDESREHPVAYRMTVDLDVLRALVEGRVVGDKDGGLIVTVHRHSLLYGKTKLVK